MSDDNKIPLRRDWALALLTFTLAILTLQSTVPALDEVLTASGLDMYPDFCIVINFILKYAAKLEGIFLPFIKVPKQLEDTTEATWRQWTKAWKIPHFLYLILQEN
ncbi:MAG: hypothetical protein LBB90_11355 [Tannerella sp.]|nr:hypothetical protein [Tannerella sp.]